MKSYLLIILMLFSIVSFGQNILVNGYFETGSLSPWAGYNNQVLVDDITNSKCGNANNGDSSVYQVFNVSPSETYHAAFDYRWVSGAGTYNMTVRIKDGETGGNDLQTVVLNTTPDIWHRADFNFTVPSGITTARIIFYKPTDNRPFRIDNVYIADINAPTPSFVDPDTPINAQPLGVAGNWELDFSDEFNLTNIDPLKWVVSVSSSSRGARANLGVTDWWWKAENAFLNGSGELVLRGTKVDNNTMYCGSIESRNLYEPTFGYLEARIQIAETAKGNHTAFWLQGSNQGNVDNSGADGAEIDVFESAWVANNTKAVVHFDGYGVDKKNHTISYNTPNLHTGYHVFGLHWTASAMDIYYDGVKVVSTNPSKPFPFTVDPNGYPLVPQVPEWLWLSVGASFGDGDFQSQAVGTLSDALVDYVRVYKPASTLGIENIVEASRFKLFPNPTNNVVNIKSEEINYSLEIHDLNGRMILQSNYPQSQEIDVKSLSKGVYIFKINLNKAVSFHKVVIQ